MRLIPRWSVISRKSLNVIKRRNPCAVGIPDTMLRESVKMEDQLIYHMQFQGLIFGQKRSRIGVHFNILTRSSTVTHWETSAPKFLEGSAG